MSFGVETGTWKTNALAVGPSHMKEIFVVKWR